MDIAQDVWMIVQIVLLDLSLGGDNSIVIGMAAKALPPHHQKRVILLGAGGAIVARFLLAGIIVWLLSIPYLKTVGGLVLIWIGMKLIGEEDSGEETKEIEAKSTFWGAVGTIIAADFIMSLDNVLAIVAATNAHLGLLLFGMMISVPIIIAGSTIVVKIMDKFPQIIYVGSIIIGWAAGGMLVSDKSLGLPAEYGMMLKVSVTALVAFGGWTWQRLAARKRKLAYARIKN